MFNETVRDNYDIGDLVFLCNESADFGTITTTFFLVIFVFSVTGNGLILGALICHENLRKVTNMFVLNLASSDLVFSLTLPFWAFYHSSHWIFGDFACKFLTGAYFVGLYSSVILLTALTMDRFATVVMEKRLKTQSIRQRCAVGSCVAAWVISVAASLHDALDSRVEEKDGVYSCEATARYPEDAATAAAVGYYLQVSLLFLLPFVIITFCYCAIVRTLLTAPRLKRSTIAVVMCIIVVFFVCWAPYNILIFVFSVYEPEDCDVKERLQHTFELCRILAYSHCCMNPFLFVLLPKFRRHLFTLFHCTSVQREARKIIGQSPSNVIQTAVVISQAFELRTWHENKSI
ncbi:chemokine XC receptor 1 [Aplochiton taeniatus]